MGNSKSINLLDRLKHIFLLKRTRITLYIAAVLWVAVAAQIVVNRAFKEEIQITEAFVKSDTEEMQSSLEMVAEYKSGVLSETSNEEVINKLADSIGLIVDDDISVLKDETRSESYFFKKAKQASSEIKVVSIKQGEADTVQTKNYIIVRLSVLEGIKSIEKYKKQIEKALDQLGVA